MYRRDIGFPGTTRVSEIVLSQKERVQLREAAAILANLRAACADDDRDDVTDIALAAHVCSELADSGKIDI